MVRNPYNDIVYKVEITPDVVDCIVFWTKNAAPMLDKLIHIEYPYYFQYTINGYGKDMEPYLPSLEQRVESFKAVSEKAKVILRYDPIIFTEKYSPEWHLDTFRKITSSLKGRTNKCVISFVDVYKSIERNIDQQMFFLNGDRLEDFASDIASIARENGMAIGTCSERVNLDACGLYHNKCIDPLVIKEIIGCPVKARKDTGQRDGCGCITSVEVGKYDTCMHGCKYCYATHNIRVAQGNWKVYDPSSPLLCDTLKPSDKIRERKLKSIRTTAPECEQMSFF